MYLTRSKNPRKFVKLSEKEYLTECQKSVRPSPDIHVDLFVNAKDEIRLVITSMNPERRYTTDEVLPVTWYREELAGKKDRIRHAVAHFKNHIRF
jgi:hypothetical protein